MSKILFFLYLVFSLVLNIALFEAVYGYSTYGSPSEFGNDTNTTCYVGGDLGVLNCTGELIINRINTTGEIWSNGINVSAGGTGDLSISDDWNFENNDSLVLDNSSLCRINTTGLQVGNISLVEGLPEGFFIGALDTRTIQITEDIDKEHIEGDVNTFVDIAGDIMTGSLIGRNLNMTYGNFSEQVIILGNVGIGTDNPTAKLDVRGNISTISNFSINTNQKIFLGDGGEGEIYYDGTKLVIKVS